MNIETEVNRIGDKVWFILDPQLSGIVTAVIFMGDKSNRYKKFQVNYFLDGEYKVEWLHPGEILWKSEETTPMGLTPPPD